MARLASSSAPGAPPVSWPSDNFRPHELVASRDHPELEFKFYRLRPAMLVSAMRVVLLTMQPFRDLVGQIDVLSFCRSRELSLAIPGAKIGGDHEDGLACDFKPTEISAEEFLELATSGQLEAAGATWDKLNLYTSSGTWHVAHRLVEAGPPRMRIYVDWQLVD